MAELDAGVFIVEVCRTKISKFAKILLDFQGGCYIVNISNGRWNIRKSNSSRFPETQEPARNLKEEEEK